MPGYKDLQGVLEAYLKNTTKDRYIAVCWAIVGHIDEAVGEDGLETNNFKEYKKAVKDNGKKVGEHDEDILALLPKANKDTGEEKLDKHSITNAQIENLLEKIKGGAQGGGRTRKSRKARKSRKGSKSRKSRSSRR